ncbi:transposase, IS30 family [Mycolicibacterium conceptionense]|uniref:Transposase, IS30 family n=1 Tax=Mycolicibacterium conceptionense TaxID=451644 RepID=A0A0U1DCL7_9MYCO|nr:transposase, IS30 family [Mycolicibacterium conceptionense]
MAQSRSEERARRPQPGKLARNQVLHDEVQAKLLDEHSPEQIAARLIIDYLDYVAAKLNTRPRKTLGWKTPAETLDALLCNPLNPTAVA